MVIKFNDMLFINVFLLLLLFFNYNSNNVLFYSLRHKLINIFGLNLFLLSFNDIGNQSSKYGVLTYFVL